MRGPGICLSVIVVVLLCGCGNGGDVDVSFTLDGAAAKRSVIAAETEVVPLRGTVTLTGDKAATVTLKLTARIPTGCQGAWIAKDGDERPSVNELRVPLRLTEDKPMPFARTFGFTCRRSGDVIFEFACEVAALADESDTSNNRADVRMSVQSRPPYVVDEVLVAFKAGVSEATIKETLARLGTEVIRTMPHEDVLRAHPGTQRVHWLRIASGASVPSVLRLFAQETTIEFAEPNLLGGIDDHQEHPDDPHFQNGSQWSLLNWGQPVGGALGRIDADVDAPQGWDLGRDASKVVVVVVDTGIDLGHLDLHDPPTASNLWTNPNEVAGDNDDNDNTTFKDDIYGVDLVDWDGDPTDALPPGHWARGHGTSVAGIIGAIGNNARACAGICWKASIMSIRIMPMSVVPDRHGWTAARFTAAVDYAILKKLHAKRDKRPEKIRIMNLSGSMFYPADSPQLSVSLLGAEDILLVCSAGNDGQNLDDDEDIYRDVDNDGFVSAGDVRLTEVSMNDKTFLPGSVVAATDGDAAPARRLVPFAANELHTEGVAVNGAYDPGEAVYFDQLPLGTVNGPNNNDYDQRLAPVPAGYLRGSIVAGGDGDVGLALVPFAKDEKHAENIAVNGAFDHGAKYPAVYTAPHIVCVGGSDHRDEIWSDSNYGSTSVDLLAPGPKTWSLEIGAGNAAKLAAGEGGSEFGGTSAAAPHVSGIAALAWSHPGLEGLTAVQMKDLILRFVDRRPQYAGKVVSGGRLRWPASSELGDAPNSYETTCAEPQLLCATPATHGPMHLDYGNEWFGDDATTEHNATTGPLDQEPGPNIWTQPALPAICATAPGPVNADDGDDGDFVYTPPPPWVPGVPVTVAFTISSDSLFDVDGNGIADHQIEDGFGGRYDAANPDKRVYVNAFFDWNADGDFGDPGEHVPFGPTPEVELALAAPPATRPVAAGVRVSRVFVPPAAKPPWIRWRLDYGENAGANEPKLFFRDPSLPVQAWKDIAIFGEVEDYPLGSVLCFKFREPELDEPQQALVPVAGEEMRLFQGEGCQGQPLATAVTGAGGYADFTGLAPGVYSVSHNGDCRTVRVTGPVAPTSRPDPSFPAAGTDVVDFGARIELVIDGKREVVTLHGQATVRRSDPVRVGDHTQIETRAHVLTLSGVSSSGKKVTMTLDERKESTGVIRQQNPNAPFPAQSLHDLYVRLHVGSTKLHHAKPIRVQSVVQGVPPHLAVHTPVDNVPVPLLKADGTEGGSITRGVYIPLPPREKIEIFVGE